MARHGLEGQLGVPSERSPSRPSSTVRAEAPAGRRRRTRSRAAAARAAGMWLWRRVIETIQHDPPVAVAAAAAANVGDARLEKRHVDGLGALASGDRKRL